MKRIRRITRFHKLGWAVACVILIMFARPVLAQSFGPGQNTLQNKKLPSGFSAQGLGQNGKATLPTGTTPTDFPLSNQGLMMQGMDYQIHVLGQVETPGTYRMGPSVRVAEALGMAGGLKELASKRNIELRQNPGRTRKVDLFQFTKWGNLNENPFVQDNDVIFVPFMGANARIEGPVKDPGTYELSGEKNVWDVIQLAGGYTSGTSGKGEVVIVRFDQEERKQLLHFPNMKMELEQVLVQNGDIIIVPHIFNQDRRFDYAVDELPADNVFYPSYNSNIFVVGAVTQAGSFPFNPNLSLREYVNLAGPTPLAKIKHAHVMKADGTFIRRTKKYTLSPGDTVVVPERKMTTSNVLSWYQTFASTVFTGVALKSLIE